MARKIIFFIFILTLFLTFETTSFARTELTLDEATYIYENVFTNKYFNTLCPTTQNSGANFNLLNYDYSQLFMQLFNSQNTVEIKQNTFFVPLFWDRTSGWLLVFNCNAGKENLPHLYFEFGDESWIGGAGKNKRTIKINFIDDNKNLIDYSITQFNFSINSSTFTLSGPFATTSNTIANNWTLNYYYSKPYNSENIEDSTLLAPLNHITTLSNTNSVYSNWNGGALVNSPIPYLLQTDYVNAPPYIPGNPSGDIGGDNDDSDGGSATTPDYSEDLDNINNSINNQGQAIIDNQNQNTDKITGSIDNLNESLTAVPDISETTITSGEISDALNFEFAKDPYANFWLELTTRIF